MNPFNKVAFYTLGCKLNFSETSTIARMFEKQSFARVDFEDTPDIFVINTCSVTDNADKKCKQIVRKARKINPEAFIAIIGCYAQLKPTEIASIEGVNLVLGANEKFNIIDNIEAGKNKATGQILADEIKYVKEFVPSYSYGDRTRSFLKIQDGCNYFCSFCTIPLARGTSRSNSISETVKIAKEVAATEVKEVVLTGVNIGDFGKTSDEDFLGLIKELDQIDGIDRYRISSIEPNLLSDEIIKFVSKSKRFVPHFHIPLQSGSDTILELMRRRYDTHLYKNRVETIKALMPNCCIGVDVIVGFPGETKDRFLETYNFLNELDVSYLHVFTYSERDNTTAVRMLDDVVSKDDRAERSKMLHILSEKKKRYFYQSNSGKYANVLFEQENNDGIIYGFTENYIKVKTAYNSGLGNKLQSVLLQRPDRDGIMMMESIFDKTLTT